MTRTHRFITLDSTYTTVVEVKSPADSLIGVNYSSLSPTGKEVSKQFRRETWARFKRLVTLWSPLIAAMATLPVITHSTFT